MANGIVATAAEYLVKLGVSLDYSNMQKLEKFLDSSAFKAAQLGTALVAGSTAIYKFMKSMTSVEMEYVNLARKQQKSIENVRAEQNALKAMGKTAVEVAKDPALKKIQNDLVEIGKGMQLPDLTKPLESVRALQKEFYALKMTLQYALQWLNYYLLQDLRSTIERITAWFQKIREWVQTRLKPFTRRLATFLGDFVRGVEGILRIVDKIFDFINRLPASIKTFGVTFAAVLTALNAGPLGKMLMILTAIGDLIKDYENFTFNKSKGVTGAVGQELYGNVGKYFDEEGRLSAAGKQFLESNGIDPSGVVNVAFDTLWGPISEGDWLTALGNVFQPMLDALNKLFTEDIPALLNGETSIVGLIVSKLNGSSADEFGEGGENDLSPFGKSIVGGVLSAVGVYLVGNKLAGLVDEVLGENAFASFAVLFGSKMIGSIAAEFQNLTFDTENGTFSNPIVQSISDLINSVFSIDLSEIMMNMGIMNEDGVITEQAAGIAGMIGNWSEVLGRVISHNLNPISDYVSFTIDLLGENGLVHKVAEALEAAASEQQLTSKEQSDLVSAWSAVFSDVSGMLGLNLFQAIFAIGSDTDTRRQFLSLFLGEFLGEDAVEGAYDFFGEKYAGGGLWDKFLDVWLGQIDEATGKRPERGGLWGSILNWMLGYDGENGHVKGIFEELWDFIKNGFIELFNALEGPVTDAMDRLWLAILKGIPAWAKKLLGIEDITIKIDNGDGTTTYSTSGGQSVTVPNNVSGILEEEGFFAQGGNEYFGMGVRFTPSGLVNEKVNEFTEYYKTANNASGNTAMIVQLTMDAYTNALAQAAESGNYNAVRYLIEGFDEFYGRYQNKEAGSQVIGHGLKPWLDAYLENGVPEGWISSSGWVSASDEEWSVFKGNSSGLDNTGNTGILKLDLSDNEKMSKYYQTVYYDPTSGGIYGKNGSGTIDRFMDTSWFTNNGYDVPVKVNVDEAQRDQELNKGNPTIDATVSTDGSGKEGKAWGGRIGSEGVYTVGEDGPEYIIPITKPNRAMALIMQMFREMGGNALRKVVEGFGLNGGSDTIGGSLSSLGIPNASISIVNNVNVTNTILVQGGDRSASEIGLAAYDASERYLLRTLQGVLA